MKFLKLALLCHQMHLFLIMLIQYEFIKTHNALSDNFAMNSIYIVWDWSFLNYPTWTEHWHSIFEQNKNSRRCFCSSNEKKIWVKHLKQFIWKKHWSSRGLSSFAKKTSFRIATRRKSSKKVYVCLHYKEIEYTILMDFA